MTRTGAPIPTSRRPRRRPHAPLQGGRGIGTNAPPGRGDDEGSTLILALVFLVAVSLLVAALVTWVGNDLRTTGKFNDARSLRYALGGAVQLETQNLRYSYTASTQGLANPWVTCTPGGAEVTLNGQAIAVYCDVTLYAASSTSRVIALDACPTGTTQSNCVAAPLLQATVAFDDYSTANVFNCTSSSQETSCGTGMTLNSWVVR